ncbi:MAG: hypothetical protein C0497_14320 [Gemmatimonas sp.]|nr:hypothetical protein [Gemmatimonas sp.]
MWVVLGLAAAAGCGARTGRAPSPRGTPVPVAASGDPSVAAPAAAPPASSTAVPAPSPQNPSPMQERTRVHERLVPPRHADLGVNLTIDSVLPGRIDVFIPQRALTADSAPLLIHLMGATWVPRRAVATMERPVIVAAAYFGSGSATYARPFARDTLLYARMLDTIRARIAQITGAPRITGVYLSGWSAGYGAIREILRRPEYLPKVDGVLLLDGIHTGYIPDRQPLADGGVLDTADLAPFSAFARLAAAGSKRFIITHTEIFPGTFASTTECTDWVLDVLGLKRVAVLEWGPMGTQLLSRTRKGRFEALGFAGNSAPDHVDLFHGMAAFVDRLLAP